MHGGDTMKNFILSVVAICLLAILMGGQSFNDSNTSNVDPATVGSVIASSATLNLVSTIHHISGTTQVTTINPPSYFQNGQVFLIPDGVFTLATGGNIGKASTMVVGVANELTWDGSLWWPSY